MGKFSKKIELKSTDETISQIKNAIEDEEDLEEIEQKDIAWGETPIVSTGSTLLDLAISGGRTYKGGIPACILAEIYGPSGSGKTAILSEIGSCIQKLGGDIMYQDPEARLDKEYARIYEIEINKKNYHRPGTVAEVFELIKQWKTDAIIKGLLTDSLAALTTDFEIEKGDKMGMRRAKEFSAGLRVHARTVADMLWIASNQERQGEYGATTPGGNAVGYYASLRIRIRQQEKIELKKVYRPTTAPDWILEAQGKKKEDQEEVTKKKRKEKSDVEVSNFIGIKSECFITKSTVDNPYRSAPVYIIFGLGVDDIRANLQYLKESYNLNSYVCPDGKKWMGMEQAIIHIEEEGLAEELKEQTIITWHEMDDLFKANRMRKKNR